MRTGSGDLCRDIGEIVDLLFNIKSQAGVTVHPIRCLIFVFKSIIAGVNFIERLGLIDRLIKHRVQIRLAGDQTGSQGCFNAGYHRTGYFYFPDSFVAARDAEELVLGACLVNFCRMTASRANGICWGECITGQVDFPGGGIRSQSVDGYRNGCHDGIEFAFNVRCSVGIGNAAGGFASVRQSERAGFLANQLLTGGVGIQMHCVVIRSAPDIQSVGIDAAGSRIDNVNIALADDVLRKCDNIGVTAFRSV